MPESTNALLEVYVARSQKIPLLRLTASRPLFMLQGLAKLLADNAPQSFKESKFENYFGRKIAVDASMHMYQFLVISFRPT